MHLQGNHTLQGMNSAQLQALGSSQLRSAGSGLLQVPLYTPHLPRDHYCTHSLESRPIQCHRLQYYMHQVLWQTGNLVRREHTGAPNAQVWGKQAEFFAFQGKYGLSDGDLLPDYKAQQLRQSSGLIPPGSSRLESAFSGMALEPQHSYGVELPPPHGLEERVSMLSAGSAGEPLPKSGQLCFSVNLESAI